MSSVEMVPLMEVSEQELVAATSFCPDCPIVIDNMDGVGVPDSGELPVNMEGVVVELTLSMRVAENNALLVALES